MNENIKALIRKINEIKIGISKINEEIETNIHPTDNSPIFIRNSFPSI